MRRYLVIAFLGGWIALFPFLPIECGSTSRAVLLLSGLLVAILAVFSLRESSA